MAFAKLLKVDTSKPFPFTTGTAEGMLVLAELIAGVETGLATGATVDGELIAGELTTALVGAFTGEVEDGTTAGALGRGTPAAALAAA